MSDSASRTEGSRVAQSELFGMVGRGNKRESWEGVASGVKDVLKQGRVSFRDKVVGASSSAILEVLDLLDGDCLASVQGKEGDSSPPSITFTEEAKVTLSQPYKDAIVLKVLDKNLSYAALSYKLTSVWRLKCGYELLDVGHGYFLAKFDTLEERERILLGGPWMGNGRYLAVKPWSPSFRTSECSFGSTMVWVRILGLPIMYYHEKVMNKIASAIGLPVVRRIIVDGIEYNVEYDSLHLACGLCDCYGHVARACSKGKEDEGKTSASLAMAIEKQQPQKDHEEKIHHVKEVNVSSHADEARWEVVYRKGKAKVGQGAIKTRNVNKTPLQQNNYKRRRLKN
ncbi:RNA-directed DNA polymerase [Arachis hypogaea]|nr:RNA-directed DNA polymerase [Arachis hypogaea]